MGEMGRQRLARIAHARLSIRHSQGSVSAPVHSLYISLKMQKIGFIAVSIEVYTLDKGVANARSLLHKY